VPGGHRIAIEPIAPTLGRLRAKLGVIAVLGNHDWWESGPRVTQAPSRSPASPCWRTKAVRRDINGHPLWIAGIADAMTRYPDMRTALAPEPNGVPTIVITHNPAPFAAMPAGPVIMLAAHTHGGQVRLPIVGSLISPRGVPQALEAPSTSRGWPRSVRHHRQSGTSILPGALCTPPVVDVPAPSHLPGQYTERAPSLRDRNEPIRKPRA